MPRAWNRSTTDWTTALQTLRFWNGLSIQNFSTSFAPQSPIPCR